MSDVLHDRRENSVRGLGWPLIVGVVALAICAAGASHDPLQFFRAYLPPWIFLWGLSLGSMALLMIYHMTGGAWGFLTRRILEANMRTLPLLALMFVPIAWGIRFLYPFAMSDVVAADKQLQHQTFYMTPELFWLRAVAYFILWLGMAALLDRWSRQQDASDDWRLEWKNQQLGAFGAVIYGVTIHFAAVDWAMTLMPAFHSSIWGPLFVLGQLVSALAFTIIVLAYKVRRPPLAEVTSGQTLGDLGSLQLTFLIAWAYMAWFQFMLIWIANLPVDIIYYLPRSTAPWLAVMWAIVLLHFTVPFFALLMRSIKRHAGRLAVVAGLILAMHLVYDYYQVTPSVSLVGVAGQDRAAIAGPTSELVPAYADTIARHWMDFLTPLGLGGIWLSYFLWQVERLPLIVRGDPHRVSAARLRRQEEEEAKEEAIGHE